MHFNIRLPHRLSVKEIMYRERLTKHFINSEIKLVNSYCMDVLFHNVRSAIYP